MRVFGKVLDERYTRVLIVTNLIQEMRRAGIIRPGASEARARNGNCINLARKDEGPYGAGDGGGSGLNRSVIAALVWIRLDAKGVGCEK